jgi:TetR/AcrR family transcriptional regulator, lmrAB and yxaGH operons repressor
MMVVIASEVSMHYDDRHSQGRQAGGGVATGNSKASMVRSAAALISARGLSATSLSDVLTASGAPRGSIYHHFPQGKEQLAQDAVRWTGERVLAYQAALTGPRPEDVLERFIGMWRAVVTDSDAAAGCVVAGVAVDTGPDALALRDAVRETFRAWVSLLTAQLEARGVPSDRAGSIASTTLAGMEGALILCQAEGDVGPLESVASELRRLLPGGGRTGLVVNASTSG